MEGILQFIGEHAIFAVPVSFFLSLVLFAFYVIPEIRRRSLAKARKKLGKERLSSWAKKHKKIP